MGLAEFHSLSLTQRAQNEARLVKTEMQDLTGPVSHDCSPRRARKLPKRDEPQA